MDETVIPETQIEAYPPFTLGFSEAHESLDPFHSAASTHHTEGRDEEVADSIQDRESDGGILVSISKDIEELHPEPKITKEKDNMTDSLKSSSETAKSENSCSSFSQLNRTPILNERVKVKYNRKYCDARITSYIPGDNSAKVAYEITSSGNNANSGQAVFPLKEIYPNELSETEDTTAKVESKISGKKSRKREIFEPINEYFTAEKQPEKGTELEAIPAQSKKYFWAKVVGCETGGVIVQYANGEAGYLSYKRLRPLPPKPVIVPVEAETENTTLVATDSTVDKTLHVNTETEDFRDCASTQSTPEHGESRHSNDLFSMNSVVRGAYYYFRTALDNSGIYRIGKLVDILEKESGRAASTTFHAELLPVETGSQYILHGQFLLPCAKHSSNAANICVPLTCVRTERKLIFIKESDLKKAFVLLSN